MGDAVRGVVRVDRINRWPSAGGVGRLKLTEQRAIAWCWSGRLRLSLCHQRPLFCDFVGEMVRNFKALVRQDRILKLMI